MTRTDMLAGPGRGPVGSRANHVRRLREEKKSSRSLPFLRLGVLFDTKRPFDACKEVEHGIKILLEEMEVATQSSQSVKPD